MKLPVLFAFSICAALFGQTPSANEWPILHNTHHTGFSPTTVLKPPFKIKWSAKVPGAFKAGPVVAEGKMVVQGREGYLHCFDAETGAPIWRYFVQRMQASYKGFTESGPCIWNGRVYANYYSAGNPAISGMHCFDLNTGRLLWKKPSGYTDHRIHVSPQVTRGRLVFCSNRETTGVQTQTKSTLVYQAQIQCWNAMTGDTLWRRAMSTGLCQNTTVLVAGDTIFASVGSYPDPDTGRTLALDTNGNILWESTEHHVRGYAGNMQYYNGNLWLLTHLSTGQRIIRTSDWSVVLQAGVANSYSKINPIMNGKYYNRGYGGFALPYSIETGQRTPFASFSGKGAGSGCGAPVAANGYIYNVFGGGPGTQYAPGTSFAGVPFDASFKVVAVDEAGNIVWWFQDRSHHCASVAIAYDKLYVASGTEGMVHCFENAK